MESYDLVVIGAGPGGYVAAIRAGQLGLKTLLVEKAQSLGGTCLNVGCIPSKALLESTEAYARACESLAEFGVRTGAVTYDLAAMQARKAGIVKELTDGIRLLMKKNKVTVRQARAELDGPGKVRLHADDGATETLHATAVLLATGSVPIELPFLPFDGERVVSSTEALAFDRVPRHLVVVGGGAIGLELGSVWRRLGAEVTVVEMLPQIVPFADKQLAKMLERSLKKQGLQFLLQHRVTGARVEGADLHVTVVDAKGGEHVLVGDKVLVAVGRKPFSQGLGLASVGLTPDEKGRVPVDGHFATAAAGVWAIGDLVAGPMLAHKAEEEGIAAVERIAGKAGHVDADAIPNVVYTEPELAQVGLTEDEAVARGLKVKTGKFFYKANGRAKSLGAEDGLAKVVADADSDRLLGVQILGARASELIGEATVALSLKASAEDLALTCHAHPTLSEILKEAALAVEGRAIHG
jgi:dihydrolipoamide dehydrogenase